MVLELAVLHVLDQGQVELWHVVLIHVEENVPDHDDALFDLLPDSVEFAQKLLVMVAPDVLPYRLQKLHRGVLDAFVEHLSVLVKHEAVGRAVQLLVRQAAGLLVIDLVDGILDGLPVLLRLGALHVSIPHLVPVNQKLVGWQV